MTLEHATPAAAPIVLDPGVVPLSTWRSVHAGAGSLALPPESRAAIERASSAVAELIAEGRTIYGVNTGFGRLANVKIESGSLGRLQTNLILSHSAGTGELLPDEIVRLVLAMKAAALARGYSGVRFELVEALLALANAGVYPCVPAKGSVGASGDLAPLAHLSAALLGVGDVRLRGQVRTAREGLAAAGLVPFVLGPKEGVALINGTQVSTALALAGLFRAENALRSTLVTGALSVEAALGNETPFDPRIHAVRGQAGQIAVAAIQRRLLDGSPIRAARRDRLKVQDPYCLRCQPQVMGACLSNLRHAASVLHAEANAVSDNPLVFADEREVLSGGNFHAEPVAFAADIVALAICEIGSISERRQALLTDSSLSGLPAFLARDPGLNSGFMLAQVTAAALTAENKALAHPASVDTIPTSANQEDHVSMATYAAFRLGAMAANLETIVALEWLTAAQAVDFHRPLRPAPPLAAAVDLLRERVSFQEEDRFLAPDIAVATDLVRSGALARFVDEDLL